MPNHPDTLHTTGETPTFGYDEERCEEGGVPCQNPVATEPIPLPPLPKEVKQGVQLGVYPPW